jgi:hypothetical protein
MNTWNRSIFPIAVAMLIALPAAAFPQQSVADGVRLWSQNCGRCHNFRPAEERSDQDWATILSHMRVRANLKRSDTQAILAFLQSSNGTGESTTAAAPARAPADAFRVPAASSAPGTLEWSVAMIIRRALWTLPEVP